MLETPVLFLIFNRPDHTRKVFAKIREQRPKFLYIAADGARDWIEGEIAICKATRDLVITNIDWECEVKTLFRDKNLGCGHAVSGGITWFFEHVEEGIILEDDCLPHSDFFTFCANLLEHYRFNENICAISGNNFFSRERMRGDSYYFSRYSFIWGWATWRRAWALYDFRLLKFEEFKENHMISRIDQRKEFKEYWFPMFEKVKKNEIDTWDFQWLFSIWWNDGLTIVPKSNLVSNIGFGNEATHTFGNSPLASIRVKEIGNIIHPSKVKLNKKDFLKDSEIVYGISRGLHFKKVSWMIIRKIRTFLIAIRQKK